jgi:hypothetical protein
MQLTPILIQFRHDTSISPTKRTLASINKCVGARNNFGVINKPLIHIEPEKV